MKNIYYKNIDTGEYETERELRTRFNDDAILEDPDLSFDEWLHLEGWRIEIDV